MDEKQAKIIETKLDLLIALLVRIAIKDKTKTDAIKFLDDLGFENKEIARIVGSTANSVSVRKAERKKDRGDKSDGKK